jgi:hypothetical protein
LSAAAAVPLGIRIWIETPASGVVAATVTVSIFDILPILNPLAKAKTMSIGTILLIILVIALLGGFSGLGGGPFYGMGYYGGGGIGLVLVIVLVLVVIGRI